MSELGISIYPSKSSFDEMQSYLTQARELGYKKIFTSLLEVTGDTATVVDHFKKSSNMAIKSACKFVLTLIQSYLSS